MRATFEQLAGAREIAALIRTRLIDAEKRMGEAEAEYNGLSKLLAFADQIVKDTESALRVPK